MFWEKVNKRWLQFGLAVILLAGVGVAALLFTTPSQAHCDSATGPVATAAQHALDAGDVKLILPYVQPEAEAELTASFTQAIQVRKMGGEAQSLADRYFIETAVRLHRTGEGASYTGVTDEEIPHAIQVADQVMESGSLKDVYKLLNQVMQDGVKAKYQAVVEARDTAARLNTVEANRERVEAELMFEKYVYGLFTTATAEQPHAEGATH